MLFEGIRPNRNGTMSLVNGIWMYMCVTFRNDPEESQINDDARAAGGIRLLPVMTE